MEFLSSAVSLVVPLVTNTIIKDVVYPFTAADNIRALELATRELRALKEDVKTIITNAEQEDGAVTNQAREWLSWVETIEEEARDIQQKYQQLYRCIWNISPNFCAIYKVSRSASKKHVEVQILCRIISTLEVITHMPPRLNQEMPASLKATLHCIKDDAHNNIIGIWGMGGVGKTHLLMRVNNDLLREPAFKADVIFVTCSKECNEENVQNNIIERLGLSNTGSMDQKQSTIYNFLKERSFVLLLDDLWSHVDLKIIGIPDPMSAVGACKRKIVLTTRSIEVCEQMEVKKEIRVDVLNWDDAWSLFKEKVTKKTINSHSLIQEYAMAVVKELGGLPLALITIGKAMHGKMDPREWEQAVKLLKQGRLNDVESSSWINRSIFNIIKLSYDNLKNDTLKQCFLHCSLWPKDFHIKKDDLVQLWMGLGLIDEPNIQKSYHVGYSYIRRLQDVCLLEIGDGDDVIKMHGVIRDMVIWIANNQGGETKTWIIQSGIYKKPQEQEIEVFGDTKQLSVMRCAASKVSISTTCSSTKLSTLLLNNNRIHDSKTLRLELFSKLTFLDLSMNCLKAFPVEICKLVHLQFLNLSYNWQMKSLLPKEFGVLTNLKYLLLRGTSCTFPDKVLSELKALRVLDLTDVDGFENIEKFLALQKDLWRLSDFEALGITISSMHVFHKLAQKVSVPIRWLEVYYCTESCLSFSSCFLENSHLQSVISIHLESMEGVEHVEFESTIENRNIYHLEKLEGLEFSDMKNMKEVIWKNLDPKDVFPKLQVLEFFACPKLTSISWVVNLPCIQKLKLDECTSIKQLIRIDELINSGVEVSQHPFLFLKTMVLWNNHNLEIISDPIITFPALEFLEVDCCVKLRKLPFEHNNPPAKLRLVQGNEEWWNNIEMEDGSNKSLLQPFFVNWFDVLISNYEKRLSSFI